MTVRDCFCFATLSVVMTLVLMTPLAFADEVRIKGGKTVSGLITKDEEDHVIVAIPGGGELKIKRQDIDSIGLSNEEERKKLKEEFLKIEEQAGKGTRQGRNYGGAKRSSADAVPTVIRDSERTQEIGHVTADNSTKRKSLFSILHERQKARVRAVTGISKKKKREETKDEK